MVTKIEHFVHKRENDDSGTMDNVTEIVLSISHYLLDPFFYIDISVSILSCVFLPFKVCYDYTSLKQKKNTKLYNKYDEVSFYSI